VRRDCSDEQACCACADAPWRARGRADEAACLPWPPVRLSRTRRAWEQGHECPEHYNPAEFLADLISVDPTSTDAEAATRCASVVHLCARKHRRVFKTQILARVIRCLGGSE